MMPLPEPGDIFWRDLTVPNAEEVREFYTSVVGWDSENHPMGEYDDYDILHQSSGETVTGICHARGENAEIPPQWMLYIAVADLDESIQSVNEHGGTVLSRRDDAENSSAIISDPANAVVTLYEVTQ